MGVGLVSPILAIYIKEDLVGGTIFAAGLASTLFLIIKSLVQLPFGKYVDNHEHKVKYLILGTLMTSIVPFIYIFSTHIYHIYLAQIINGIGAALAFPTYLSIFSTHLDKKHEGYEWGMYSTLVGLGAALTGAIGGWVAQNFGFKITFAMTGLMALIGWGILFGLEKKNHKDRLNGFPIKHKEKLVGKSHGHH